MAYRDYCRSANQRHLQGEPELFSLARWEKEGEVYDRAGIRAFRWVLLHSPLGWINPNLHLGASRTDCARLLREMNVSEGVHWLTCFLLSILAISCLVDGYVVYGYVMLLVRVPFDIYPIMLHRRNRGRVCRVLSRKAMHVRLANRFVKWGLHRKIGHGLSDLAAG